MAHCLAVLYRLAIVQFLASVYLIAIGARVRNSVAQPYSQDPLDCLLFTW